jgi:hypothetical protein
MPDMRDFLALLIKHDVDFMIVGAFVLARYGIPRGTGDIDIFINPSVNNAENVLAALNEFGMASLGISVADLLSGDIIQLGFPPARIDLLTKLTGVSLEEILQSRESGRLAEFTVDFLGRDVFIKNKRALGRNKDLADIDALD